MLCFNNDISIMTQLYVYEYIDNNPVYYVFGYKCVIGFSADYNSVSIYPKAYMKNFATVAVEQFDCVFDLETSQITYSPGDKQTITWIVNINGPELVGMPKAEMYMPVTFVVDDCTVSLNSGDVYDKCKDNHNYDVCTKYSMKMYDNTKDAQWFKLAALAHDCKNYLNFVSCYYRSKFIQLSSLITEKKDTDVE